MKSQSVNRMFRSAIHCAVDNLSTDPRTMAAIEIITEGFSDIETFEAYLWNEPHAIEWGSVCGFEYSRRKQNAILLVTGRTYQQWLNLIQE